MFIRPIFVIIIIIIIIIMTITVVLKCKIIQLSELSRYLD